MVLSGHGVRVPTEHLLIISPALIITTAKCSEPQLIKTLHFFCLSFMGKESEEVKLNAQGPTVSRARICMWAVCSRPTP